MAKFLEWNDVDLFDKRCDEYFTLVNLTNEQRLEANPKAKAHPPTIIGLQRHMQINEADYKKFKTKPGLEAYKDILEYAEMRIEEWVIPRMMTGELNTHGTMCVMRNKHSWRDSSAEKTGNIQINPVDSEIKIVVMNGNGETLNLPSGPLNLLPESDKPIVDDNA